MNHWIPNIMKTLDNVMKLYYIVIFLININVLVSDAKINI